MLDRVLHQRLQQHAGHHHVERCRIEFLHHPQFVRPEAHHLNVEIVVDEFHFFAQRHERSALFSNRRRIVASLKIISRAVSGSKRTSEEIEFRVLNRKCGLIWFCSASMRACKQQSLLLLQLDLNAHAVENL